MRVFGNTWRPMRTARTLAVIASVSLLTTAATVRAADEPLPSDYTNKLTVAYYGFSPSDHGSTVSTDSALAAGRTGADVNLRHTFPSSTAWIGVYRESDGFNQVRIGYEYDYHRDWLALVPSAQAASHGFFGATVYGEVGRRLFAIAGAGRTNLHPYWNLGFDNTHLIYRRYLPHAWRVTVDAVREHGTGDDGLVVRGWAMSLDVDWREWFVRVASDPHVNYTPDRQVRIAGGLRFR